MWVCQRGYSISLLLFNVKKKEYGQDLNKTYAPIHVTHNLTYTRVVWKIF